MSIALMSEVWGIDLPDSQKIVLLALADNANDEGLCWPSVATLARKCSKAERTIQGVIKELVEAGHVTREEVTGRGCRYTVHPRRDCTPAAAAPAEIAPPQRLHRTPAAAAPKPSRTTKSNTQRAHVIPKDWGPKEFGSGSKCKTIVENWGADELSAQIEHFTKHHRGKGNRFVSWQDAWETWVLNSRRWGPRPASSASPSSTGGNSLVADILAKQSRVTAQ